MNSLNGKKILLAVSGSIAAYKSLFLTRLLIKKGAEVKVLMTKASCDFVSPLSFSTLSKNEVFSDVSNGASWNNHVDLGLWADIMLIAPATATTMAKLANGIADNMVVACYLSAKCPVFFAPAMDLDMWIHPSTKINLEKLISFGNHFIEVGDGELASGLSGAGRMAEPEDIVSVLSDHFSREQDLLGKHIIITAGPTYEDLDPVRYIGNRSSGKMGIALAENCAIRGASVHLVLGPSNLRPLDHKNIKVSMVRSAEQMKSVVVEDHNNSDVCIFAAAVADYRPAMISSQKIKKKDGDLSIELERTTDIAALVGKTKTNQIHIGFALETQNEAENAKKKLVKKNFDLIILNSLNDKGAGFAHDTNKIRIFSNEGLLQDYPLQTKKKTAQDIIDVLVSRL